MNRYIVGHKILDVACGSGIYTDYLATQGYDVWGIDLVGEFIEKAKITKKGNFVQGEADKLPFADGEFDTVLLFDILEHGDDIAILREAKRVAKNRILVNVTRKVDRDLEQTGVVYRHYTDKSHLREYDETNLQQLAEQLDLKVVDLFRISSFDILAVFKVLFTRNKLVIIALKILMRLLCIERAHPTGYFLVLDSYK